MRRATRVQKLKFALAFKRQKNFHLLPKLLNVQMTDVIVNTMTTLSNFYKIQNRND